MKFVISLAFAALSLAGCTTTDIDRAKVVARSSIETVCASYTTADFAFEQIAATGRLSADVVNKKRSATATLAAICNDPPKDPKTAISTATRVLTVLLSAAAEARRQTGG